MKFFKLLLSFLFLLLAIQLTSVYAQQPTLESLQKKFRQYQAKSDYPMLVTILEEMLENGYKSVDRYKQLGDLYFFLKKDEKALEVFKQQAEWANKASVWVAYSDLLIWKKRDKEGIAALEKAYRLAPANRKIIQKLAGVYEYQKFVKKSERLWKLLWRKDTASVENIRKLIDFYLRNGKLPDARKLLKESFTQKQLLQTSIDFKIIAMKIYSWSNQIKNSHAILTHIPPNKIPVKELGYFYIIAKLSSDYAYLESVLKQMEDNGQDVFQKKLDLSIFKDSPERTRELIEERIDDKGETPELLFSLYKTYRAQRKVKDSMEVIEELLPLDYQNPVWYRILLKYYDYTRDYDRGIDVLEDIVDDYEDDAQVALLYLSELYLKSQDFEEFEESIERIDQPDLIGHANSLKYQNAEFLRKQQILYEIQLSSLKDTPNISPEEQYLKKVRKGKYQQIVESELPEDRYLLILEALSYLANDVGKREDSVRYGKQAYHVLRDRFDKYPTKKRLIKLILKGASYGTTQEQEEVFKKGEKYLSNTFFYLKKYRFLMGKKRYADAEEVLEKLLKSPANLGERYQVAEHTFGLVTFELSEKLFKDVIKTDQNYSMGLKRLGQIALYTSNYPIAIFYIKKYLNINAFDSESIFLLGEAYHFNRQPFKAAAQFEKLISLLNYPGISRYESELIGLAHLRLGDEEKALAAFKNIYKVNPGSLSTKINIVETLVLLKRWQEALDFIKKENLGDEAQLYNAKNEVSHSEYFNDNLYRDTSTVKAKLRHEELVALINVELGMRIQFIKHLCLNGLGRVHEDQVLLENLYRKNRQNKDLLSTIGFYYLGRGADTKGLEFLKKASRIPPYDVALNAYVRALGNTYAPQFIAEVYQTQVTGEEGREQVRHDAFIGGQSNVIEKDHFKYGVRFMKVDQENVVKTNTDGGVQSYEHVELGYKGFAPLSTRLGVIQKYDIDFSFRNEVGHSLAYQVSTQESKMSGSLLIHNNKPNSDSYEMVKADARTTGYLFSTGFQAQELRQSYSLLYGSSTYHFKDYFYGSTQKESFWKVGLSQYLMTYPHNLTLLGVLSDKTVKGTAVYTESSDGSTNYKHPLLPSTLLEYGVIYKHDWSEFLSFNLSLINVLGQYNQLHEDKRTDSKQKINHTNIEFITTYITDSFSLTGLLKYTIERLGTKTESVYNSTNSSLESTEIEARESTTLKVGLRLETAF